MRGDQPETIALEAFRLVESCFAALHAAPGVDAPQLE